jgi:hypothetical protein
MVQWLVAEPGDWILQAVLTECLVRQAGCTRDEAYEALDTAIAIMNCKRPNDMVVAGYVNIMMMFPRELLLPSIRTALANERFHVLPTVGALVAAAKLEHELRQRKVTDLKIAITRLELRKMFEDKQGDRSRAARVRGSAASRPD